MKAVMLVGGEGTRLRPLTLAQPKQLMPVANRPFLSHVFAHLARHGVDEAILALGYLADSFEGLVPEHMHGVRVTVVREDTPLDTAGALRNAAAHLDSTFLVLNGDVLTDLDIGAMTAFHRAKGGAGTIHLVAVDDPKAYGLVPLRPDGRIERFIEKPRDDEIVTNLVNAGTYLLEPDVLERVPAGQRYSFERQLVPSLLADGVALYGYPETGYWLDTGTPALYLRANFDVLGGKAGERPPGRETPSGAWVGEDVRIDPSVRIRGPVAIGSRCRLELGAVIYPSTCLGADCHVGEGAVIEESVLHDGVEVGPGARIERSILAAGVRVGARTRVIDAVIGPGVTIGADNELRAGIRVFPGLDIPDASVRF